MKRKAGYVVSFAGVTGVGKTTVLVNVADMIRRYGENSPSVCILDMNVLYSSVCDLFDFHEMHRGDMHLKEALREIKQSSVEEMKSSFMKHKPTDIYILGMYFGPLVQEFLQYGHFHAYSELFTQELIEMLIRKIKQSFDIVLIDTSADIRSEETRVSLLESDTIIMPLETKHIKMMQSKKFMYAIDRIDFISQQDIPLKEKIHFFFNKTSPHEVIPSHFFHKQVYKHIPYLEPIGYVHQKEESTKPTSRDFYDALTDIAHFIHPLEIR